MKRAFEECTKKLDLKNHIQVSMDGPNVNWKMLDLIVKDRNSNETYPNLLDVGSCSLHVVHGTFRTGFATKTTSEKVYKEKKISQLQVLEFRKVCESMLATTVAKIQERSRLKYNFARKLASLDPRVMVSNPDQNVPGGVTETD